MPLLFLGGSPPAASAGGHVGISPKAPWRRPGKFRSPKAPYFVAGPATQTLNGTTIPTAEQIGIGFNTPRPVFIKSITTSVTTAATITATTPSTGMVAAIGDLALVIHDNDFYLLSNMPTPTATGSPTFSPITSATLPADGGTNFGHLKFYTYVVNTAGAQTVQVTETGAADEEKSLTVYILGAADTTTPTDDGRGGFDSVGSATQIAPAATATNTNDLAIMQIGAGGGGSAASYTPPAGVIWQYEIHITAYSAVGGTKQLSASGSTGTFTFTAASPTDYAAGTVLVRAAPAGGGSQSLNGTTISTAESFGVGAVAQVVTCTAITTAELVFDGATSLVALGTTIVTGVSLGVNTISITVTGTAVSTAEQVFDGALAQGAVGTTIATAALVFDGVAVPGPVALTGTTIATGELVFDGNAAAGATVLNGITIASAERVFGGSAAINAFGTTITTAEQIGVGTTTLTATGTTIGTGERVNSGAIAVGVIGTTIPTYELVYDGAATPGPVTLIGTTVTTGEVVFDGTTTVGGTFLNGTTITTAERVFDGVATPGTVTLTGSTIGTAEQVFDGSASLIAIGTTIATGERLNAGVVSIGIVGITIPTAELFGVGVAAPGPVTIVATTIRTAEFIFPGNVAVGVSTLQGTTIPTAERLGVGTITVGTVTLTGTTVPTATLFFVGAITGFGLPQSAAGITIPTGERFFATYNAHYGQCTITVSVGATVLSATMQTPQIHTDMVGARIVVSEQAPLVLASLESDKV
jgi:hypothetical protein